METQTVFLCLILWHPNKEEAKEGKKPEIICPLQTIIAGSIEKANMAASFLIPEDKRNQLDQIQIALRPF